MTEETLKARDKISKLLNMTVENGCTEDEQETAMRMAAAIATRLGIELETIRAKTGDAPARKATSKTLNQEWKIHQVLAAQAAAVLYGVEIYTYSGGKGGLFFVGREENIELTEQTMFWLMRQVELLYKQNLPRGMTQRDRSEYRKTFKAACAHRVAERARNLMYEMKTNPAAAVEATGQNALVVTGYFDQLKKENADFWVPTDEQRERAERYRLQEEQRRNALTPQERDSEDHERERANKKAANRKGPRPRRLPVGNGTNAGLRAGDSVSLRRELK